MSRGVREEYERSLRALGVRKGAIPGELETALQTAQGILAEDPDYILGLVAAAQAAIELGMEEEAADYYRHLVDVYEGEVARGLPEYEMHSPIMSSARSDAEAFLSR